MPKIAISYRRTDSDATGRICDRLVQRYGKDSVFRDIDNIPFGMDFRKVINDALRDIDVLITIVGPTWRGARRFGGARINDSNDLVRIEVETALQRDIPLIPVLVGGAMMPKASELPDSLRDFSFRNAANVDSGRNFDTDIERLMRSMDRLLEGRAKTEAGKERLDYEEGVAPSISGHEPPIEAAGLDTGPVASLDQSIHEVIVNLVQSKRQETEPPHVESTNPPGMSQLPVQSIHSETAIQQGITDQDKDAQFARLKREDANRIVHRHQGGERAFETAKRAEVQRVYSRALGLTASTLGLIAIFFGIPLNEFALGTTLILAGTAALTGGLIHIGLAASRAAVFWVLGLTASTLGLIAIFFGIPLSEFTLGTTLILAGTVALTGGLIHIGLAASRAAVFWVLGLTASTLGLIEIFFGIPLNQSTFGTLILAGTVALTGGLIHIGLAASRAAVFWVLGLTASTLGVIAIFFGIPLNESTLGGTLIVAGAIALMGGLSLVRLVNDRFWHFATIRRDA
jgi:hypothetical protein